MRREQTLVEALPPVLPVRGGSPADALRRPEQTLYGEEAAQ
jgi:hypothetical protein